MLLDVSLWSVLVAISDEALDQGTPWLLLGLLIALLLTRLSLGRAADADLRARRQVVTSLLGVHVALLPITGVSAALGAGFAHDLHLIGSLAGALATIGLLGLVVFGALLPRVRISVPRILQDVIVIGFAIFAVFATASRAGVNLSGIVATGAVLTAVIGFALQDTLGNLVGGLSLQLDSTVRVGDWIRVQDVTGRVVEIRWRSTSIETRNWETVVIPNSVLTRTQVMVLGRRAGESPRWRRWIYFYVDFRYTPTQVIETALKALRDQPIPNLAPSPEPSCILLELAESSGRYAVRYYLEDFALDDPTDSVVRTRIFFALNRAGIPLSIPAQSVFVTEESVERRQSKREADYGRRLAGLKRIKLFADLSQEELSELATSLHLAPFAAGEVINREGAEAHHLYMIEEGRVSVRVGSPGQERELRILQAGDFFGERSLLTGERRSATVVAVSDVRCYRLDADAFRRVLSQRPDLAAQVANQLAERQVGLLAARNALGERISVEDERADLLEKIRSFFGL